MKKLLITVSVALLMCSCGVSKVNVTDVKVVEANASVLAKPLVADIEINQEIGKIRDTLFYSVMNYQQNKIQEYIYYNDGLAKIKAKYGADVIVNPSFDVEKLGTEYKLIITGWVANYINFRPIEEKDIWWTNKTLPTNNSNYHITYEE